MATVEQPSVVDRALIARLQRQGWSVDGVGGFLAQLTKLVRGMTYGYISAHLADVYGSEVSKATISTIADKVLDGLAKWQNRPLDAVYPVVFIDAIHVKVRDGQVRTALSTSLWPLRPRATATLSACCPKAGT